MKWEWPPGLAPLAELSWAVCGGEGFFYSGTANLVRRATPTREPDKEHSWITLAGGPQRMEIWVGECSWGEEQQPSFLESLQPIFEDRI